MIMDIGSPRARGAVKGALGLRVHRSPVVTGQALDGSVRMPTLVSGGKGASPGQWFLRLKSQMNSVSAAAEVSPRKVP